MTDPAPGNAAWPLCPSIYQRRSIFIAGTGVHCELPDRHDGMHEGYDAFDNFYKWPQEAS